MDTKLKIEIWEEKIHEYWLLYRSHSARNFLARNISVFEGLPLAKFNISAIFTALESSNSFDQETLRYCADKLIDMKLMYAYLDTADEHFDRGVTLIVGNNELEKLNPNTISLLRGNHYKVFLLSVIMETTLDFMQLVFFGKITDYKKGKWQGVAKREQVNYRA